MKLAVMQPYLFPYIGYFQAMSAVDKYVLHDGLHYIREGFMHRNRYLATRQGPAFFIASVQDRSSHALIRDVRVADQTRWRRKMKNQLALSYARSPCFEQVFPRVEQVIDTDTDRLAVINARSIIMVHDYLGMRCELVPNADAYRDMEDELARLYSPEALATTPQALERKVMRALMICRREGASTFINAIGGRALYSPDLFREHGVDLRFVQSETPDYPQHNARRFFPNLSILDVLFNCSIPQVRQLLTAYQQVQ